MTTVQSSPGPKGNRLKQLRAFCNTALLGTLTKAAENVMSSQPAVSQHIRALEGELEVRLFERRGPRVALTRIGESLFEYTMPLVQAIDRLPDTFSEDHFGVPSDALIIGAGPTSAAYLLPRYLKRFRERYPDVQINVWTGDSSQRLRWLRAYKMDLTLLAVDKLPQDLRFHELTASRFMLITPLNHPLVGRTSLKFTDVEGHRMVGHIPGQHERQSGDSKLRQYGVEPNSSIEVDGWSVVKLYVAAGLGISVVPEICITEQDEVWSAPLDQYLPPRRYGAATRNDEFLSLAARRFLEIVAEDDGGDSIAPDPTGAR